MSYINYVPEEITRRGENIYLSNLRENIELQHFGEYLVLDVETGQYEIGASDWEATKRMIAKRPEAVLYGVRIGYPATYRLGAHFLTHKP